MIVLLALSDDGAPTYDHGNAAYFASLGAPAFACTPDQFPDLIAAAIERRDIATWAAKAGDHHQPSRLTGFRRTAGFASSSANPARCVGPLDRPVAVPRGHGRLWLWPSAG